jgi:predicted N-formylglutamate amidohydrolase
VKPTTVILSCEHGGNRVPAAYTRLYNNAAARAALNSHRGYDIGALRVARALARSIGCELHSATVTRLLVDLNRSIGHSTLHSEFCAPLKHNERASLIADYYRPHRKTVTEAIDRISGLVCHIGVHSFTPILGGEVRNADIGLLYDPKHRGEREFCLRWQRLLLERDPALRVRRNYPYLGTSDTLPTALRRHYPKLGYLGIELEINQAYLLQSSKQTRLLTATLAASLTEVLGR